MRTGARFIDAFELGCRICAGHGPVKGLGSLGAEDFESAFQFLRCCPNGGGVGATGKEFGDVGSESGFQSLDLSVE